MSWMLSVLSTRVDRFVSSCSSFFQWREADESEVRQTPDDCVMADGPPEWDEYKSDPEVGAVMAGFDVRPSTSLLSYLLRC